MSLIPAGDSLGVAIIAIGATGGFLATTAVVFRVWARKIQGIALGWNDYTCILALVFALALIAGTVLTVIYGLGQNVQDVNIELLPSLFKCMFIGQILWVLSNTCVRISIIFLYISIFRLRTFRIASYVVLGLNLAYFVGVILQTLLICRPVAFNWDQTVPGGTCGDQKTADEVIGIFNILFDVSIIALPMPMLWNLQIVLHRKLALSAIFGMGIIICIITTLRVRYIVDLDYSNTTKSFASVGLLAILEPLLGIVNACLPVMRPVLQKFSKTNLLSRTGKNTNASERASGHKVFTVGSGSGQGNYFRRLGEVSYPLKGMNSEATSSRPLNYGDSTSGLAEEEVDNAKRIYVRREWDVKTTV